MKVWTVVPAAAVVAALSIGCNANSRYAVLSFFFDGVPPPAVEPAPGEKGSAKQGSAAQPRRFGLGEHGPYGAKLCYACHQSVATNALVLPREELCFRCHDIKTGKKYVHGPLASGGCTACHDPHSSRYRYLLVSESDDFCFRCHDQEAVGRSPAHAAREEKTCTTCHDAHMSDKRYLLR